MKTKDRKLWKWEKRLKYLDIRDQVSDKRRKEAKKAAFETLKEHLKGDYFVLSFASFGSEIDMNEINQWLCDQKRLILPKVEENKLNIYQVDNFKEQIELSKWKILEPCKQVCRPCSINTIGCALIPAVAFDNKKNRIGFGKGFYDRLLSQAGPIPKIGVGFKEQLLEEEIPIFSYDISLDKLLLF